VAVTGLTGATMVSAGGRHTCALAGGLLYCWGANDFGQLGRTSGATTSPGSPVAVSGATFVATGISHTCATAPGGLQCWGLNVSGQVDPASATSWFSTPQTPNLGGGLLPVRAAAGRAHTCALEPPTGLKCFGANNAGQLTGTTNKVDVTLLAPGTVSEIAAGGDHSCALTGDGGIQCWGANDRGQLGNGQSGPPVPVPAYVSGR
jgi:alpha-tubulin suppressor-like RCC1 family protein